MNYKTYAEAKIANPDSEIVTTGNNWSGGKDLLGTFEAVITGSISRHIIDDKSWVICNPADYCSSVGEFLKAGFVFSGGDFFTLANGEASEISEINEETNKIMFGDEKRYILSAAALNGGCKIPVKAVQWTIYNNTMPLCELTDEQAAMLFNAWRSGADMQFKGHESECWQEKNANRNLINKISCYRVKPKSEREMFIEASSRIMHSVEGDGLINDITLGALYDNGLRYKDSTKQSEV